MASAEAWDRFPYPVEDPATLRSQQRALGNLGELLLDSSADVDDHALTLSGSWRSDTATTAVADVQVLASAMSGDSGVLATASSAVSRYAGQVEEARTDIDGFRTKYDTAVASRDHANARIPGNLDTQETRDELKQANQSALDTTATGLDGQYASVLSTLRTRSAGPVSDLDAALRRFVGPNPPETGSLGEVAFQQASAHLTLTGDTIYEFHLRQEGLLSGATPQGAYAQWLENAARYGIDPSVITQIARDHDISPEDFADLDGLSPVQDPDGKTYFLLPGGMGGDDARKAVLMTYIVNCGTDYDAAGKVPGVTNDFTETPYSSAEVQRILGRQDANDWSYNDDVGFVEGNRGRLMTTPNGMLMGMGGNWLQNLYSLKGGTTFGDIFMLNIDGPTGDAATKVLQQVAESGTKWGEDDDGKLYQQTLDLDRLLHHEERHSQQWADEGYAGFIAKYATEQYASLPWWMTGLGGVVADWVVDENGTEEGAGLHDGGYE